MRIISKTVLGGWAAAAIALGLISAPVTAYGSSPLRITFQKCLDPATGLFIGTVLGDCGDGTVVYAGILFDDSKDVWHIAGTYSITTPECSFIALCSGKVNTHNGNIALNGTVIAASGDFVGARVQVRARLIVGPNSLCSEGTIQVTPSAQVPGLD